MIPQMKLVLFVFAGVCIGASVAQAHGDHRTWHGEVVMSEIVQSGNGRYCLNPNAQIELSGPQANRACVSCTPGFTINMLQGGAKCGKCSAGHVFRNGRCGH